MCEVDPAWEVSAVDVKRMLDDKVDFLLVDVRQPEEYGIARIKEARFIPLGELPITLPDLETHAGRPIVTVCHKGLRSLQAAAFLRQQGFKHTRSMAGGIDEWSRLIDPSVPRY